MVLKDGNEIELKEIATDKDGFTNLELENVDTSRRPSEWRTVLSKIDQPTINNNYMDLQEEVLVQISTTLLDKRNFYAEVRPKLDVERLEQAVILLDISEVDVSKIVRRMLDEVTIYCVSYFSI